MKRNTIIIVNSANVYSDLDNMIGTTQGKLPKTIFKMMGLKSNAKMILDTLLEVTDNKEESIKTVNSPIYIVNLFEIKNAVSESLEIKYEESGLIYKGNELINDISNWQKENELNKHGMMSLVMLEDRYKQCIHGGHANVLLIDNDQKNIDYFNNISTHVKTDTMKSNLSDEMFKLQLITKLKALKEED